MLKTWVNTALGETFETQGDSIDHAPLLDRRKNYDIHSIPAEVLLLTAGVDVQKDRLECQLVGWGKNWNVGL